MHTNYYVIYEEDQAGSRSVLDIIDMSKTTLSQSTVIRYARSMKSYGCRVFVYVEDNPKQPARKIYASRK